VHGFSGGIPRLINTLCDNCLLEAFLAKLNTIDDKLVVKTADQLSLLKQEAAPPPAAAATANPLAPEPTPEPTIEIAVDDSATYPFVQEYAPGSIEPAPPAKPAGTTGPKLVVPITAAKNREATAPDKTKPLELTQEAEAADPAAAEVPEYEEIFERLTQEPGDDIDSLLNDLVGKEKTEKK
jgi:outer membrane biosynthesis protein TonB